jgi:hypothetical protein
MCIHNVEIMLCYEVNQILLCFISLLETVLNIARLTALSCAWSLNSCGLVFSFVGDFLEA